MKLQPLIIKDLTIEVPIIQGGMGVGISLSRLAGAVSKEGGLGVVSAAQTGFAELDFMQDAFHANLRALGREIHQAKELSGGRPVGVNIMRASRNYAEYVDCCVKNGADVIISGAGLPIELPLLLQDTKVKFAPVVSSLKAAKVLFQRWDKRYHKVADFVVIEGPKAGGHLGFTPEEAAQLTLAEFDKEVEAIVDFVRGYEASYGPIPVVYAGGVFDRQDIDHYLSLGCQGVQMATRFVVTEECDAPQNYKEAYLKAKKEDIVIVQSPVGLPGRAIANDFVKALQQGREPVEKCFRCMDQCDPATTPYCISMALIRAAKGKLDHALLFCGENAWRLEKMTTVKALMEELNAE